MSVMLREDDPLWKRLDQRLDREPGRGQATTIVSFQDQVRGWLGVINSAKNAAELLRGYDRLHLALKVYSDMTVLPYDGAAHAVFQLIRPQYRRVGTMDLRIASIALVLGATLLTRNLRDFRQVPGLAAEDWSR